MEKRKCFENKHFFCVFFFSLRNESDSGRREIFLLSEKNENDGESSNTFHNGMFRWTEAGNCEEFPRHDQVQSAPVARFKNGVISIQIFSCVKGERWNLMRFNTESGRNVCNKREARFSKRRIYDVCDDPLVYLLTVKHRYNLHSKFTCQWKFSRLSSPSNPMLFIQLHSGRVNEQMKLMLDSSVNFTAHGVNHFRCWLSKKGMFLNFLKIPLKLKIFAVSVA